MPSEPLSSSLEDPLQPDKSPEGDGDRALSTSEFDAESLRRSHLSEESYVKAMGFVNYTYGVLLGLDAVYLSRLTVLQVSGRISAPWTLEPGWLAIQVVSWIMAILAILAGHGFFRFKKWALRAEVLFSLCWLALWFLSIAVPTGSSTDPRLRTIVVFSLWMAALATPMINLWDIRHSVIFERSYQRVFRATSSIRVRAQLPLELKMIPLCLFLAGFLVVWITGGWGSSTVWWGIHAPGFK
jgi:hypothetical protein